MELAKAYDAKSVQEEVGAQWDAERLWHAEPDGRANRYSVVIPPPNVTGALHLGHAINNTLQDILVRCHRMRGDNTVWLPGTDHAGIATQTVVDKRLQASGQPALKEYKQIEAAGGNGREQFLEKVNEWKTEYEARILGQLKAMGCSCDWDRVAFTMDEPRSKAVREAFFQLFKAGLIYRGKRLVNWDPVTQTALADDEVEMEEVDGHFYYLKYPVCDERGAELRGTGFQPVSGHGMEAHATQFVTVATTRPETMLGDTAVAINPKDPRAAALRGKFVKLPIVDRIIPIIEDEYVVLPIEHGGDPADGKAKHSSGFLKVTPAHDPNDYALGLKYKLVQINVMAPDASISLDHGWGAQEPAQKDNATLTPFLGLAREPARASIVAWFKDHGLVEKVIPYRHSVGHSYRSHAPIEPYLSDQWYCKVTDPRLAGAANAALARDQRTAATSARSRGVPPLPSESEDAKGNVGEPGASGIPIVAGQGRDAPATGEVPAGDALRFFPERYAKTYETWHENIRDWCISRQLWWGHRIPVWSYLETNNAEADTRAGVLARDLCRLHPTSIAEGLRTTSRVDDDGKLGRGLSIYREINLSVITDDRTVLGELKNAGYIQDPDVLDTWFSSALWPLSTLGWPEDRPVEAFPPAASSSKLESRNSNLPSDYWNPTSVLATGRDIITLWVSRMVMFNQFLVGRVPFHHVYINPTIQDGQGQRMSKSLGNGVDPLDVISTHGADAMRFTLASMATQTQDVKLPVDLIDPHTGETFEPKFVTNASGYSVAAPIQEHKGKRCVSSYGAASGAATPTDAMPLARNTSAKFDLGRNFCNKLWNATRFVMMQLDAGRGTGFQPGADAPRSSHGQDAHATEESQWSIIDRWVLSRLARTIQACNEAIDSYRFDLYAKACYDFVWRDYCDWYLEAAKPAMKDPARRESTARILATCLDVALRLMHPMIPYITEKLWGALSESGVPRGIDDRIPCETTGPQSETKSSDCSARIMVAPYPSFTDRAGTLVDEDVERTVARLQEIVGAIRQVRNDNKVDLKKRVPVTIQCPADLEHHLGGNREFIEGLALCTLDAIGPATAEPAGAAKTTVAGVTIFVSGVVDAVAAEKRKAELQKSIAGMRTKLSNEGYVAKAPPKVVEETRAMLDAAEAELAKLG